MRFLKEQPRSERIKTWLKEIEGNGSIIHNRMEICLRLGRMEEEKAIKLMLGQENRDMRKELQKVKKEDWNQRYWKKETEVITSKMTKLELDEDIGVTIMEEILAGVTETAEKALEMDMDTSHSLEVGI